MFYLLFQGVLVFQVLVFSFLYFISNKKDILYYAMFLFFAAIYFFVNAPYTFFGIPEEQVWNSTWYDHFNTPVIIIENLFYLLFLKTFFTDITSDVSILKVLRITLGLIPLLILLFIILTYLGSDKQFIFYTVKMICVIPSVLVAYVILKKRPPFAVPVANGLLCTIAGTSLTVIMIILGNNGVKTLFTIGYPLFFIRLGLLGDMIFYLLAILKKWHYQEKLVAVEKLQSQLAVEKLRNKISGELHDDIGSTLSGISMYSHMLGGMLQSGNIHNATEAVGTIQKSADEIVGKLGDLVWAINPGKDSFANMLARIHEYGIEMCRPSAIEFEWNCERIETANEPGMDIRRNVYLIAKEAINNAVKYSHAKKIRVDIEESNEQFNMRFEDNGDGFDMQAITPGNGLENMQKRAESIGARLQIQSQKNRGTAISFSLKIPH
ncbi:MAG: 7TM diverse intracellular signaling domain-containing protein [Ferruginibacter sp.]